MLRRVVSSSMRRGLAAAAPAVPEPLPVWEQAPARTGIFINNEFHPAKSGKTFATLNPASGQEICQVLTSF